MTEFTKTKMHFALAMLGTLFAMHNLLHKFEEWGFAYLGYDLKIFYAYGLIAGLLSFAVYCYAVAVMTEKQGSRWEKLGNYSYSLAILVVPLYAALYGSSLLADHVGESHIQVTAPSTAVGLGILWLGFGWWLRHRLGVKDCQERVDQLVFQELDALDRAPELFEQHHYDLAVIEAWKAIESRLRRALLLRGYTRRLDSTQKMIDLAIRKNIIKDPATKLLQEVRHQWNVAVGTEPLTKEAADAALTAARHILATIPVNHGAELAHHAV
ncbi:MAG: hypothetical protein K2R98_02515 [Gemmataceae bacterium]|nr:hypothetical protein [Gemmataceae bacterium]